MATKLLKPVKRELMSSDRKGRTLIATLEPGDCISFRPKGSKRSCEVYLGHCYMLAQIMQQEHDYKKRMEDYNAKKKAGYSRLRKPKRPQLPFNKIYFDALNK